MSYLLVSIPESFLDQERRATLDHLSGNRNVIISSDRERIEPIIDEVEIALGNVPRDLVARARRLIWFQQFGTGTEWLLDHPEARGKPFILTNCSDDYGVVLSEHIMALILAVARQLPEQFTAQQRKTWLSPDFNDPRRFELRGKHLLLLGTGSIGKAIAQRARAFEMSISGLRSDPSRPVEGFEKIYGTDQLLPAIAEADLVVNTLPLTAQTRKLVDARAIAAMKPNAFFFNIGRGATVDEKALITALRENRIAGAGLDVFEKEPLPPDSPLWTLPNVIITPHDGGNHQNRMESWVQTIFDNLKRFSEDRALRNRVDKQRTY